MKCTDLKQAIDITRKLAVSSLVYDRTGISTSLQVPAALGMKKAILRGAPPTLKLPNMQTVAEARMA